jgi:spore coat polysaccharide biosynthesis protein SpsF
MSADAPAGGAIILQARVGSSRLPGKVLRPFGEVTLLEHNLARLARTGIPTWVATSTLPGDDAVSEIATRSGAAVFRGDEADVLGRFAQCVDAMDAAPEYVVRICADRPFVCSELIHDHVAAWDEAGRPAILSSSIEPSFPIGLEVEVVDAAALAVAASTARDPYEREHVTPHLYRHPETFHVVSLTCSYGNYAHVRTVVDTAADYDALTAVGSRLHAADPEYGLATILSLATVDPSAFPGGDTA